MNKEEMVKEAYTLMVKNNPDEAIKNLIRLDKELDKKNKIVFKAIEYIEKALKDDYSEFMYMYEPEIILDILRGKDEN